ncbi:MAG: ribonuclease III [Bacteroidetes bacterium]|nr:MAG: ribonuclease III [Bacteroidota bacterium]
MNFFKNKSKSQDAELTLALKNVFGFKPGNISLYKLAFRHKSAASSEYNGFRHSNERLEYLGDAVLGSVVADFLFKKFPYKDEGFLTEIRSRIVSRQNLNMLSRKLGFDNMVQTSKESQSVGTSILGDAFEAFVGALYLDKGYRFTNNLIVQKIIQNHLDLDELVCKEVNFKSKLIEWAQKEKHTIEFTVADELENGKKLKIYVVNLLIDGQLIASGKDYSIKKAEQNAAELASIKISSENLFSGASDNNDSHEETDHTDDESHPG